VCLDCHRVMVLNGKGANVSQMNTPVEYLLLFCAKCGKIAVMIAHAKFDRSKPDEKPVLAFTTFWGALPHNPLILSNKKANGVNLKAGRGLGLIGFASQRARGYKQLTWREENKRD